MDNYVYELSARAENVLVPSIPELYGGPLPAWFIAAIAVAFALLASIGFVYYRSARSVLRNTPTELMGRTLLLISVYPMVGVASVASLLVPKAAVFCETLCHLTYSFLVYKFFCLVVAYSGGESNMIVATDDAEVFTMRTPPCCCCCMFMRPERLTKRSLRKLRLLVLQVPIVQGAILFVLNIVNISNAYLYDIAVFCTLPFMVSSVLVGEWSVTVLITMLHPYHEQLRLKNRFHIIQLILFCVKLQNFVANEILKAVHIEEPGYPVTPRVMMNSILQVVILLEMLGLAWLASLLYRTPNKSAINKHVVLDS